MKYGNSKYHQAKFIFTDKRYKHLSKTTKQIYSTLSELEHRFVRIRELKHAHKGQSKYIPNTDTKEREYIVSKDIYRNYFYCSDKFLAKECGCSIITVKRAKAILKKEVDLIQIWQGRFLNSETGECSQWKITCYRLK